MSDEARTTTIPPAATALAGLTLECDGCGRLVRPDKLGANLAVLTLSGLAASVQVHCPMCAERVREGNARDQAAHWAAEAAGGTYYEADHYLAGLDGGPTFFLSPEAALVAMVQLEKAGVHVVLANGGWRLAYRENDRGAVALVVANHGGRMR